jgi:hypothetical protein
MEDATNSELQRSLGRLEAAVEALTREVRESNTLHSAHDANMDSRVAKLERWNMYVVAFGAGIGGTVLAICSVLWRVIPLMR